MRGIGREGGMEGWMEGSREAVRDGGGGRQSERDREAG